MLRMEKLLLADHKRKNSARHIISVGNIAPFCQGKVTARGAAMMRCAFIFPAHEADCNNQDCVRTHPVVGKL